ncbi:MAG TPA: hypothetical protein DEO82_06675 [Eubacterium sp.]|nr:hypothetical protein [Eubacterium sp.]
MPSQRRIDATYKVCSDMEEGSYNIRLEYYEDVFNFSYVEEEGATVEYTWADGVLRVLRKSDELSCCFIYDPEVTTHTDYETVYGVIPMDIDTESLAVIRLDGRIVIRLSYRAMHGGEVFVENKLEGEIIWNA